MQKHFVRNKKIEKLLFLKGKKIFVNDFKTFLKKYKVHDLIRILTKDFGLINKKAKKFTHFNIQYTIHKPGRYYLITSIAKRGYSDGVVYKHPILKNKNFILAKCISVKNDLDYSSVKNSDFKYSLRNIKNVDDLKKAIIRRYKKTLVNLSNDKKLALGVAITKLKIIERF